MKHTVSWLKQKHKVFPIVVKILDNEESEFHTALGDNWENFEGYYTKTYWVTTEMLEYLKEHFDSIKEEALRLKIKEML